MKAHDTIMYINVGSIRQMYIGLTRKGEKDVDHLQTFTVEIIEMIV